MPNGRDRPRRITLARDGALSGALQICLPNVQQIDIGAVRFVALRAFSGKVVAGFPLEDATNQWKLERFPIQLNRKALQRASSAYEPPAGLPVMKWVGALEVLSMCDYSLHGVASRPARVGDQLVTRQFWNTTTRGFSPVDQPGVAACLLPGTEVVFQNEVVRELTGFQLVVPWRRKGPIPDKLARFRQINTDNRCTHHDALEFPDGEIVLLTHLASGQRATVLQLPAADAPARVERKEREGRTAPEPMKVG